MSEFEKLLNDNITVVDRFIKFKVRDKYDADDILQETCLSAYEKFYSLKDKNNFKSWLLSIARNKCTDFFRKKATELSIPLDSLTESRLTYSLHGIRETCVVSETISKLKDNDKEILYLYYFKELSQEEISKKLGLPLGTVKSRLHNARHNFKEKYPYQHTVNGENIMKQMPKILPEYKIEKSNLPVFPIKWEEIMGWFLVPKLGEKLTWAMYDFPERTRTEVCKMEVVGKAEIHGIEGVEIVAVETDPMDCNSAGGKKKVERRFVAQLTDTHCRLLAESHEENGVKHFYTFLDGDDFLGDWGFGEDNCGNEINISSKGDILREGNIITASDKEFLLDVVGRYNVTINGKTYDTVCVIDFYTYINGGAMTEQFIDKNGKTIICRRFNRDDWGIGRYKTPWSERFPDNEKLYVNGDTYVHWYDCITDYIL